MRKNTIPATPLPCNEDNSIIEIIDNLIDNSTHTPIQTPHELSIIKLSEAETSLSEAIAQLESAKAALQDATTAPQPVVNMDVIDLESEAIRVAAIEAKQALDCRTAQLVLIARRTRVQNAIHAVKNAVEAVNDEVSLLLQNRMKIIEKNLSPMLSGLNEYRHVASALGWRAGTLAEACESIERDYVLDLPEVALPKRMALPNVLAVADVAMNGVATPRPLDGTLMTDLGLYNRGDTGRSFDGDVQALAEKNREAIRIDGIIDGIVDRHDRGRFAAEIQKSTLGGNWVNVTLPTMGSVRAY